MSEDASASQPHAEHPAYRPDDEPQPAGRRRRWWPWVVIVAAVGLAAYIFLPGASGAQKKVTAAQVAAAAANAPIPVVVATTRMGSIPIYLTGLGSVTALNTAAVKSRVDGQLMRINFVEGQVVREGFPLAELDPRPFQVQLMQAEGQKAKDEATLDNDKIDLQRYQVLMQQDSIPKQQLDTQVATVKQAEATVQSDQAQVESAKLNLVYCKITAPISGRVGLRQVDAFDRDMKTRLATGALFAIDNQIDPTTGTVRLRAQFANEDDTLFPSQFVNARVLVDTIQNTVIVPTAAIQRSPQEAFVYVVDPVKHTVSMQTVDVRLSEGDTTAIRGGLTPGQVVVVDGVDRLRPGGKVAETQLETNPTTAAAPPPAAAPKGGAHAAGTARNAG